MNYKNKKYNKILILGLTCLIVFTILPLNANSAETSGNKLSKMKTIYMKADCQKIILYRPVIWITHIGPLWFTTEYAYLAFIIDKEFTLKLDGQDQVVDVPAMVIPYKFLGFGPLYWIKSIKNPTDGNVTLIGWCQDVVIHPMN